METCNHLKAFIFGSLLTNILIISSGCGNQNAAGMSSGRTVLPDTTFPGETLMIAPIVLDTAMYDQKMLRMVHNKPTAEWPVKTGYPLPGAILPFHRIVAFYGNLYSKGMGVLGALPADEMLDSLSSEVRRWEEADSLTSVMPALHYIAVTAQPQPGKDQKYRLRMPSHQIDKVIELAGKIDALVFLDIQLGHSTLADEIPRLKNYLLLPQVHLGIDPEYSMKGDDVPCVRVGTMDAADINYASEYLATLVKENNLPPKILVVHRFTKGMVTGIDNVITRPEVQIVMHMDGFGDKAKKLTTYTQSIVADPVQFTGFKLFYKNDKKDPKRPFIMRRDEILSLYPVPLYIQYQ